MIGGLECRKIGSGKYGKREMIDVRQSIDMEERDTIDEQLDMNHEIRIIVDTILNLSLG